MEEDLLNKTLTILEDRVSNEMERRQVYVDLMPLIALIDPGLPYELAYDDPVFEEAVQEWNETK